MSFPKRKAPFHKFRSRDLTPKEVRNSNTTSKNGFEGFYLYFKDSSEDETIIAKTKCFQSYIAKNSNLFLFSKIKDDGFFTIDHNVTLKDDFLNSRWENLRNDLLENTAENLNCMGLAMHQSLCNFERESGNDDYVVPAVHCRLINVEPIVHIKNVRVNSCNKLIAVKGTVIKASDKQLLCTYVEFQCSLCKEKQIVRQKEGNYTIPSNCVGKGCRAQSKFLPLLSSKNTQTLNYQTIKLQDIDDDDQRESARIPRTIHCLLENDLVSSCIPGDDVTVVGVVKTKASNASKPTNRELAVFDIYIESVSVVNEKTNRQNSSSVTPKITFNTLDYYMIQKIHAEDQLFRLLVHSLCPNIYGHEVVKAGLLLALFGGTENAFEKRKDCHVLLVGDPGLGKSQMLHACCNVAPRGVFVCGNTSTGAGLTVTVSKEAGGEFALEAGALVLADQGCCCIDEFDKGPSQHACLLEVMEQQSISIAKAGISRNLPTRTSILAAANPVGGHYNHAKTVIENLKINGALLSRFDLIFILLDQSDERSDVLLSEHVLALHSGAEKSDKTKSSLGERSFSTKTNLKQSLLLHNGEELDNIPHSLMRKYIAYAQKYVKPQLSDEAKAVLESFYSELRTNRSTSDYTPVTARQLESMKRLTQARAKVELREETTAEDATDVVEIVKHSLASVFIDEHGGLDFTRSPSGTGVSGKKQVSKFLSILEEKSKSSQMLFTVGDLREAAQEAGVAKNRFYNTLQILNLNGVLLKKPDNMYQLVSTEY